jgi:hypothetical protein
MRPGPDKSTEVEAVVEDVGTNNHKILVQIQEKENPAMADGFPLSQIVFLTL